MNSDLSFVIALDGAPYPVQFQAEVLDEFQRDHVVNMDLQLRKFADEQFGPTFYLDHQNRLCIVAQLIRDAMREQNGILIAKYALWMASHYPEISGIRIHEDTYEFTAKVFDEITPDSYSVH